MLVGYADLAKFTTLRMLVFPKHHLLQADILENY